MVALNPNVVKYCSYLGFALVLWLLPSGANFPPLFAILCFLAAIIAFIYAAIEGRALAATLKKSHRKSVVEEELDLHALATRTHYAMKAVEREAEQEFMMPVHASVAAPVAALPPSSVQIDAETQVFLDKLTSLSKEIGWVSVSVLKQRRKEFRTFSPEEIREFFQQLANAGIGTIKGNTSNLEWIWSIDQNGKL